MLLTENSSPDVLPRRLCDRARARARARLLHKWLPPMRSDLRRQCNLQDDAAAKVPFNEWEVDVLTALLERLTALLERLRETSRPSRRSNPGGWSSRPSSSLRLE